MAGVPADLQPLIDRIDVLTRGARTSWFGLLSYMAFVGVTLVGVKDEDFFIIERETALPLVNVSVPTNTFFYVAPILGVALFVYFHLQLIKLWEALHDALNVPQIRTLGEHVLPWLVTDFALMGRTGALRKRPGLWVVWSVSLFLAYLAPIIVLGWFWWRSMPKHDPLLTLGATGLSLFFALYMGQLSWRHMRALVADRPVSRSPCFPRLFPASWPVGVLIIGLSVVEIGWLRIVPQLEPVLRTAYALAYSLDALKQHDKNKREDSGYHHPIADSALLKTPTNLLASADLANVDFSYTPEGWLGFEDAHDSYRWNWCAQRGLPKPICETLSTAAEDLDETAKAHRKTFCQDLFGTSMTDPACHAQIRNRASKFEEDWKTFWKDHLSSLHTRDLSHRDFRNADLQSSQMQGADLSEAQMQGADLSGAQMQGAYLSRAQMQGAHLRAAQMQGADLRGAQMQGADLSGAQMQGADLSGAQMQGAALSGAQMQGADLSGAQMQGALLWGAQMQGAVLWRAQMDDLTDLSAATLRGAALRFVDDTTIAKLQPFWNDIFADGTILPEGLNRPAHWATEVLDDGLSFLSSFDDFTPEWHTWMREDMGMDPDNPQ